MYIIFRDGFTLLAMGYKGPEAMRFKLAYIEAFNRMEAELAKAQPPRPARSPALRRSRHAGTRRRNPGGPTAILPHLRALCSRLISMSIPVFTALESRVYKQAPDRPFSGARIGAQWEPVLHRAHDRRPALP